VRGDQVFGELFCATTDGITSTDDSFPDEDFFPDISALSINDMADDAGANANANANANAHLNANVNLNAKAVCNLLLPISVSTTVSCTSVWSRCDLFVSVRYDLFIYSASMQD
jgi:hypothetical protein